MRTQRLINSTLKTVSQWCHHKQCHHSVITTSDITIVSTLPTKTTLIKVVKEEKNNWHQVKFSVTLKPQKFWRVEQQNIVRWQKMVCTPFAMAPIGTHWHPLAPLHNISKCPTESKGGYWAKFFFQKCGLAGGRGVPLCGRFSAWAAREGGGRQQVSWLWLHCTFQKISVKLLLEQCVEFCQGLGVEESDFRRRFKR